MAERQQTLSRALEFHGAGQLVEAESLYRKLLDIDAADADALHYLGVIGLQLGRFEDAVPLLERAVEARPDYVDAIINLGNGLQAVGRHTDAANCLERGRSLAPDNAILLANLGGALARCGQHADAVRHFRAALAIQPELVETRRSLADSLVETGKPNAALAELSAAMDRGASSLAMQVSMANALRAADRGREAVEVFEKILSAQPQLVQVRDNLANTLRKLGRLDDAVSEYRTILEQDPDHVEAHYNLGLAFQDLGRKKDAQAAYRKAIALQPTYTKAWHGLSAVSESAYSGSEVEYLHSLEDDPGTADEDRMRLAFALGRYYERNGRHEEAARQYGLANSLRRAVFDYDVDADVGLMQNLERQIDAEFLAKWQGAGSKDKRPIFIVGMPRSGTTLVEQILASHSSVHGGGEMTLLPRAIVETFPVPGDEGVDYTGALAGATPDKFSNVARNYLDRLPNVDTDRVTDKLPHNFLNVGLIGILFPRARIVHCRRDPRDTCFSIYKHLFGAYGHFYAYDLVELAKHYNGYARLMQHWESILPGRIHTVDYEALVDDQETTSRALIHACGLEWEPACLEFHKLERPVATLSANQVRQPVYRGSIGAWRNYESMLRPLLEVLDLPDR